MLFIKAVSGDGKPVQLYKGSTKIAGYHTETKSGESVTFADTYNDIADVELFGNTVQKQSVWAKNLLTNSDFSNGSTGWSGMTIDASTGVAAATNSSQYGRLRSNSISLITGHKYYISAKVKTSTTNVELRLQKIGSPYTKIIGLAVSISSELIQMSGYGTASETTNDYIACISDDYASSLPRTHYIDNVLCIDLTATFGAGKEPTKVQMDALMSQFPNSWFNDKSKISDDIVTYKANSPSLEYPADVVDASGNLLSNGAGVGAFPPVRSVNAVSDSHNTRAGVKTKRISDWLTLDSKPCLASTLLFLNYKRVDVFHPEPLHVLAQSQQFLMYDNTTKPVPYGNSAVRNSAQIHGTLGDRVPMWVGNELTGFGDMVLPTADEWKGYFSGWKMCNADGSSPYYKSEVPYTPSTWAEWTKVGGFTADSSGLTIVPANTFPTFNMNTSIKPATKYGFLLNVVAKTYTGTLATTNNAWTNVFAGSLAIPTAVGNNKVILTSQPTITANNISLFTYDINNLGTTLKIKDIRIYELPTGSQIEADFTNLTADQLAAKYPFQGQCIKNWKHVTDGLGQTAVLPTASYDGYTPYKMLYQLAVPVEEQYDPAPVPTYLDSTTIETDSQVKPEITATAKINDY